MNFLKDILFPKTCMGCGFLGTFLCERCRRALRPVCRDLCLYCQRETLHGLTHPSCQRPHGVDGILSVYEYNWILKKIVAQIKYRLVTDASADFFRSVPPAHIEKYAYVNKQYPEAFLQPIPLHPLRQKLRGFNQAELIARFFQNYCNRPIVPIIRRARETAAQAKLPKASERAFNLQNAFIAIEKAKIPGPIAILVDDVVTTGSTVKEAARVLKIMGVSIIMVFSLARG